MQTPSRQPDDAIKVGYVRRAHGIKGAAIVRVLDDEFEKFVLGRRLSTDNPEFPDLSVVAAHPHKDGLLVSFEEVADRNQSERLRGTSFFVASADRRQLDEDEYWPDDLVGLDVVDRSGLALGSLAGVVPGAAQDRLVVDTGHGEVEVPFVAEIVFSVDVSKGIVVLDPPDGLFGT